MVPTDCCGRFGCQRQVASGMQCSLCDFWFHQNCTGLNPSQYQELRGSEGGFTCMSCITKWSLIKRVPVTKDAACNASEDDVGNNRVALSSAVSDLNQQFESMLANQRSLTKLLEQLSPPFLSSDNPSKPLGKPASSSPPRSPSQKAEEYAIKKAAISLCDKVTRSRRAIAWGSFPKGTDPKSLGVKLATTASVESQLVSAKWLRSRRKRAVRGLIFCFITPQASAKLIANKGEICKRFHSIRDISSDRPLAERKEVPSRTSEDNKLLLRPVVALTPLELQLARSPTVEPVAKVPSTPSGKSAAHLKPTPPKKNEQQTLSKPGILGAPLPLNKHQKPKRSKAPSSTSNFRNGRPKAAPPDICEGKMGPTNHPKRSIGAKRNRSISPIYPSRDFNFRAPHPSLMEIPPHRSTLSSHVGHQPLPSLLHSYYPPLTLPLNNLYPPPWYLGQPPFYHQLW